VERLAALTIFHGKPQEVQMDEFVQLETIYKIRADLFVG
jgi:hypothetical protein